MGSRVHFPYTDDDGLSVAFCAGLSLGAPPQGGQPGVVEDEARSSSLLSGANVATPHRPMIDVATDAVNHTRLKHFTDRITKRRQPPLLELPEDSLAYDRYTPHAVPTQSKQIVAQSISRIPASK